MSHDPKISIVASLFNDGATAQALVERIRSTMESEGTSFEVILIDDGSADDTAAILRRLEAADSRVRVFELTRNFGQAAALACGLFAARGGVVVTLDGDLQNPPEEIPKLLRAIDDGAAVATGYREQRYESTLRWLGSRVIHWLARWLTHAQIRDFGGNFKAYRRDVLEETKGIWAPGKPFFPLALWLGHPVTEVPVRHEPRRFGKSRYSIPALLRINLDLITSFSTVPLTWLGVGGVLFTVIGFGCTLAYLLTSSPSPLLGPAAFFLLLSGVTWIALGLLGIYLGRVYRNVAGREPAFVVRRGPLRESN